MQRLYFEKQIDLNHALQELISISVNENLNYEDDIEGRRAKGELEIVGEYLSEGQRERFTDAIEIDVLAPFNRLEEGEAFHLEIQDFDYHIQTGDLNLEIQVIAYGVGEKKERHILVDETFNDEAALLEEIQSLVSKQELVSNIEASLNAFDNQQEIVTEPKEILEAVTPSEAIDENSDEVISEEIVEDLLQEDLETEVEREEIEVADSLTEEDLNESNEVVVNVDNETVANEATDEVSSEEGVVEVLSKDNDLAVETSIEENSSEQTIETSSSQQEVSELKEDDDWQESESVDVEDLFDDDAMAFVTYPIYVVRENDSYEVIAQKYQMDADELMAYNQHVALTAHQLLVIPPR